MDTAFRVLLALYAAVSSAAVLLYLPKILGFRYGFRKPPRLAAREKRHITVVIPARGESGVIGDLFASIARQTYGRAHFSVHVIVNDPADPTVGLAQAAGARVFVVPAQTCKGDALDGYFRLARPRSDAFVIVDADAVLAPGYLAELNNALEYDCDIYLTRKFAKNCLGGKRDRSVFSNCSALTWPIVDGLGNGYRMHKGMPLNLCGQGMMLRARVVEALGGWPFRTLTEDYELKLHSLLRGFSSMFYPHAVIYTEEALGHGENYLRRVRWLTGYSQCDRKYRREIARQARGRGRMTRGEREYFFGLLPLFLFLAATLAAMVSGCALALLSAVKRTPFWRNALLFLVLFPAAVLYLLLFLFGLLAWASDREAFLALSPAETAKMLLFDPLYLLEYIPLFLTSRLYARKKTPPVWRQTARISYHRDIGSSIGPE